jgi:capsid protein
MATAFDEINVTKIFDDYRSEYRAAKQTRFSSRINGIHASGSGADYHYASERDYLFIIERARHHFRNDMVVGQGIRRLVANIVQDGFQPDPQTGDKLLNKALKDAWWQWAMDPEKCHSEGELPFPEQESLVLQHALVDGDILSLLRDDGTIQQVEGHRPRTPRRTQKNVVHGILLDNDAKRKEVWISKEDLSWFGVVSKVSEIQPYPFRDLNGDRVILQFYLPDRFSQRRGVSVLAPTSETIQIHDDLQFSTMVKAQMAALVVFLREQLNTTGNSNPGAPIGGGVNTQTGYKPETGGSKPIAGIGTGIDYCAPPGQTVKGFAPNIPNAEFFPHTLLLLTFIAVNLDMPVQMLLLDPMKSNFSSWRGAVDQARIRFRKIQNTMVNRYHVPVWKWKAQNFASESLALRRMIGNNPLWRNVLFSRPRFRYIEPLKDAQADSTRLEKFLSSPRRVLNDLGEDWDEVYSEIIDDRVKLLRRAMKAANYLKKFDESITWRDILNAGYGAQQPGAAMQQQANQKEQDQKEQDQQDQDTNE